MPPGIVLIGNASIDVANLHLYNELGATATDNIEGNITDLIEIGIHLASEGTYVVTYNVMDMAGNPAVEVTRTMNILSKEGEEDEEGEEEASKAPALARRPDERWSSISDSQATRSTT